MWQCINLGELCDIWNEWVILSLSLSLSISLSPPLALSHSPTLATGHIGLSSRAKCAYSQTHVLILDIVALEF